MNFLPQIPSFSSTSWSLLARCSSFLPCCLSLLLTTAPVLGSDQGAHSILQVCILINPWCTMAHPGCSGVPEGALTPAPTHRVQGALWVRGPNCSCSRTRAVPSLGTAPLSNRDLAFSVISVHPLFVNDFMYVCLANLPLAILSPTFGAVVKVQIWSYKRDTLHYLVAAREHTLNIES
eukprot:Gb_36927 [translate_table: standard]